MAGSWATLGSPVDVARSDGKLRRITAEVKGKSDFLSAELRFRDVDQPVTIHVPSSGKPIDKLPLGS